MCLCGVGGWREEVEEEGGGEGWRRRVEMEGGGEGWRESARGGW